MEISITMFMMNIKLAIRVAAEIGVPVINTDEGIKAKWTTEEEDFVLIKYTRPQVIGRRPTRTRYESP